MSRCKTWTMADRRETTTWPMRVGLQGGGSSLVSLIRENKETMTVFTSCDH